MKKLLLTPFLLLLSLPAQAAEDAFALIDAWLSSQRLYDRVPGLSAAVVQDGKTTWSAGYGLADLERSAPAREDTIYGICSISKLFTGIAVMQLRDAGRFELDDPLTELLPWFGLTQAFDGSPEPTLRATLTHSAGLPRESDFPYWMPPDFDFPSYAEIRERLASQATIYPAERYFQYSNLGLTLAGEIVSAVDGRTFADYVRQEILDPLQLEDRTFG